MKTQRGFTLIELMIAVGIIAILAAMAYPSYREYIVRSRRVAAQAIVLEALAFRERVYAENYRYDVYTAGVAVTDAALFPSRYSVSPRDGGTPAYTIALASTSANAYVVRATRAGTLGSDKCGDFEVNNFGAKSLRSGTYASSFGSAEAALAYCWK